MEVLSTSCLRDRPTEGFQGDVRGFGPAASTGVEGVDRGQLVCGELEVEDT